MVKNCPWSMWKIIRCIFGEMQLKVIFFLFLSSVILFNASVALQTRTEKNWSIDHCNTALFEAAFTFCGHKSKKKKHIQTSRGPASPEVIWCQSLWWPCSQQISQHSLILEWLPWWEPGNCSRFCLSLHLQSVRTPLPAAVRSPPQL